MIFKFGKGSNPYWSYKNYSKKPAASPPSPAKPTATPEPKTILRKGQRSPHSETS